MKKKLLTLFMVVSLLVTGVFAGFAITGGATANASNENGWIEVVGQVGFFEVEIVGEGFYEIEFEEIVRSDGETERLLEVCLPHFDGFICEDVELEEEELTIDFRYPDGVSTAIVETELDCGVFELEIVLTSDLGHESRLIKEFDPDHKLTRIARAVEIGSDVAIAEEGVTGTICGIELTPGNVIEASANMEREESRGREED